MLPSRQAAASSSTSLCHLLASTSSSSASPRRFFSSTPQLAASAPRAKWSGSPQETQPRKLDDEAGFKFNRPPPAAQRERQEGRTSQFKRFGTRDEGRGGGRERMQRGGERRGGRDAEKGIERRGSMASWRPVIDDTLDTSSLGPQGEQQSQRQRSQRTSSPTRNSSSTSSASTPRQRKVPKEEEALSDKLDWYRHQARRGDPVALYNQAAELIELVPQNQALVRGSVQLQGQYLWLMCNAGRVKDAIKQIDSMKKAGICPTPSQFGIVFAGLAQQPDVKTHTASLERCASFFAELLQLGDARSDIAKAHEAQLNKGGSAAILAHSRAKVMRQITHNTARFHAACASYIRLLNAADLPDGARATYRQLVRLGKTHIQCIDAVLDSVKRPNEDAKTPLPEEDAKLVQKLVEHVRELHAPEQIDPELEHHVERLKYVVRRLAWLCMVPAEGETEKPELKLLSLIRDLATPRVRKREHPVLPEALRVQALSQISFYYTVLACTAVRDTKLLGLVADKCLRTRDVRLDCFTPHGLAPFRTQALRALRLCAEEQDAQTAYNLIVASRGTDMAKVKTATYAHPVLTSYYLAMGAVSKWNTAKALFRMYVSDRMNGVFKTDLKYGEASHQVAWKPKTAAKKVDDAEEGEEVESSESGKEDAEVKSEESKRAQEDAEVKLDEKKQSDDGEPATAQSSTSASTPSAARTEPTSADATAALLSPPPILLSNAHSTAEERPQNQLTLIAANREDHLITRFLTVASTTLDAHGSVDHSAVLTSLRMLNILRPFDASSIAPLRIVEAHEARARHRSDKNDEATVEYATSQAKLQLARAVMQSVDLLRDAPRDKVAEGETEMLGRAHRRAYRCQMMLTGKTEQRELEQEWMQRGVVEKSAGLKLTAEDFRELRRGGDAA